MPKMNQRSDSLKENLQAIGQKPLNRLQSWLLSHTRKAWAAEKSNLLSRLAAVTVRSRRARARAICVQPRRAGESAAAAASGHPARTKGVRAAASRARAPAGTRRSRRG